MSGVPYAEALGRQDAGVVIAATSARLAKVFESKSAEELEQRPAPGKWCLREVMAHLADCEIAWGWRLRQVLARGACGVAAVRSGCVGAGIFGVLV